LSEALYYQNIPHLWALIIVKQEVKVIMNFNIHKIMKHKKSTPKFLHLLVKDGRDHISIIINL
jgi:hypothetical protein